MLDNIGDAKNVAGYMAKVKDKQSCVRLMGFGHRVYKNFDPRATIIRDQCHKVLKHLGKENDPQMELALELERIALSDPYFKDRKLYPNVDFYSGIIYKALGIPIELFTVFFAIGRMPGWIAQWLEYQRDPEARFQTAEFFLEALEPFQNPEVGNALAISSVVRGLFRD